jgi:hypothetical protein
MTINVIPKAETLSKKTLEEYIKIYWQALCPLPKKDNPAWENDGSKDGPFNNNVNTDLYMLSPSTYPQTAVTRNIEVPSGKGLFIPVVSVVVSECETSLPLVATANKDQSSIDLPTLNLELDNSSLTDLDLYNFAPEDIGEFNVTFPAQDAIWKINHAGTCNAVAAGRYIWTEPLSSGHHTVHFGGVLHCAPPEQCIETKYSENITYNITVP